MYDHLIVKRFQMLFFFTFYELQIIRHRLSIFKDAFSYISKQTNFEIQIN